MDAAKTLRSVGLTAVFLCSALIPGALPAIGGELRPYAPPERERAATSPRMQKGAETRDVYYEEFTRQVRTLTPQQRGELKSAFERRRDQALQGKNWDEWQHYSTLLTILGSVR
jgi:hypothetical protein